MSRVVTPVVGQTAEAFHLTLLLNAKQFPTPQIAKCINWYTRVRVFAGARVRACVYTCSLFVIYSHVARQMILVEMTTLINVIMYDVNV